LPHANRTSKRFAWLRYAIRGYIVRERVDEDLFVRLVQHIRTYGHEENFYHKRIRYFDQDGLVYWTMGAPIDETAIVNRCKQEQTYEYRLKHGTLPESRRTGAADDAT